MGYLAYASHMIVVGFQQFLAVANQPIDPDLLKDALVATSGASAVLWTGALIIVQLTASEAVRKPPTTQPVAIWQYARTPLPRVYLKSPRELGMYTALGVIGLGIFAPIFALFGSPFWLRIIGLFFLAFYARPLMSDIRAIKQLRDNPAFQKTIMASNPAVLKPYEGYIRVQLVQWIAILVVVIDPSRWLVLVLSVAFLFIGYQVILVQYAMARRPFEPKMD